MPIGRGRTLLYSFSLCCADVMAPSTDCRKGRNRVGAQSYESPPRAPQMQPHACLLTLFLMFDAVPNSFASMVWTFATCIAHTERNQLEQSRLYTRSENSVSVLPQARA